MTKNVDWKLQY
jgi:hypothetical protein